MNRPHLLRGGEVQLRAAHRRRGAPRARVAAQHTAMLTIMAAFAQLERDTMIERTRAGLAAAAANGRKGGRPRKVDDIDAAKACSLRDKGVAATDIVAREIPNIFAGLSVSRPRRSCVRGNHSAFHSFTPPARTRTWPADRRHDRRRAEPDQAGIGARPAYLAKALSLGKRSTLAASEINLAAVNSAHPGSVGRVDP